MAEHQGKIKRRLFRFGMHFVKQSVSIFTF